MDTSKLKKFAQYARRSLIEQVGSKLNQILSDESPAEREHPEAVAKLKQKIAASDETQVVEQVAYTWFNRFCALRFMDVNEYNRIMVVSPLAGQFQPEILAEAKAGHIDDSIVHDEIREKIFNLLNGAEASRDPQSEAFRLLIVAVCNDYHRIMPYLFERIEDYTELLMPGDLLSGNSILAYTREAMTPDACESVESIGWLYQFYVSEKKDKVFEDLKNNVKITAKNIPAATQLFTPHWIVRYLVENSLGRLWMLNNPSSKVIEQMDYYIRPRDENQDSDFLKISSPEELKICDPACGSGHMLTYAYDLLYAIYLDDGRVDPADIPEKILTNNLYGIEIDERASELAAFALTMKAVKGNPLDEGNNRRRFFRKPVKPNICRLEKVAFSDDELDSYIEFVGKDLFTQDLRVTLKEFEEADNFGSLIQPTLISPQEAIASLQAKDVSGQLFLTETHKSVLKVLDQAEYLSPKYHVVVANPPYMGGGSMNGRLAGWVKENYSDSKTDLFSVFIERNLKLAKETAYVSMITMQSWMYLSSFEKLRLSLLKNKMISSMVHLGARAFDSIGGEVVQTTAFTIKNFSEPKRSGLFVDVTLGRNEAEKEKLFLDKKDAPICFSGVDFLSLPGNIISYDLTSDVVASFKSLMPIKKVAEPKQGLATMDNNRFLRFWYEPKESNISFDSSSRDVASNTKRMWFPVQKGGEFRRWFGNNELVINWLNDGKEICDLSVERYGSVTKRVVNREWYFKRGLTFSRIGTGLFSVRDLNEGYVFETAGCVIFPSEEERAFILGYLNSSVAQLYVKAIAPTLTFQVGDIGRIPFKSDVESKDRVEQVVKTLVKISMDDWDSFETSWDFKENPLVSIERDSGFNSIGCAYNTFQQNAESTAIRFKYYEEKNNKYFIEAYGLENSVSSEVELKNLSLQCNPSYRYDTKKSYEEMLLLYREDTIKEFISFAVGCMFGRYSLGKEGLILANQGETLEDYLKLVPSPLFEPDGDNVIPLIDLELEKGKKDDWFEDDINECFKVFLKATFGKGNYNENLRFIEDAIGRDIKKYFSDTNPNSKKGFYGHHLSIYKKRPIYWLFTSPKGSFNALIYMHRYRSDTVSVVLNDYLLEFRTKLEAKKESYEQTTISANAEPADKTKALKAIEKIRKVLEEIKDYERDILYPLAGQNKEINLDKGVKHNYPLFGKALKKVNGLS